jgi:hypothetical protein
MGLIHMWSIAMSVSFPFQREVSLVLADAQSLHHLPHGILDQNKTPCAETKKKTCRISSAVLTVKTVCSAVFFRHGRVVVVQFQYGL